MFKHLQKQLSSLKTLALAATAVLVLSLPAHAIDIETVTSDKGVKAWLVSDASVPLISIRFSFKGGSAQDPEGKEGLANFMTALFDEGAGDQNSDQFQEKLDDLGAEMSFFASQDKIIGGMRMLSENKDAALDLLKLAVNDPRFDQDALDRIRYQLIAGIEASQRDPDSIASRKFAEAFYGNHPYARPSEGTVASLNAITPDDLKAFHRKNFARDNLNISVVGDIKADELAPLLDKIFGDLPASAELVPVPDAKQGFGVTTSVTYDLPQTSLTFAYPGVDLDDKDFFAAYLMNQIMGGGFSSRLYEEVREKRGLAYSVSSGLQARDHANSLMISTATRPEKAQESLKIIREQVAKMAAEGPTEAELQTAKNYVIGAYAVNNLNSSSAVANTLVGLQDAKRSINFFDERVDLINAVTADEIKAVAAKIFNTDPAILIVGPAQ
ncbi:M16 family metallopeptidase [Brucellaceae bacterium C25G]